MKIGSVVFDCDGTLVNSLGYALESFNYALAKIGEAPRDIEQIKRYFGAAADRIFLNLLGDEKKALAAFEHYFDHQSALASRMNVFPGIIELLETLRAAKIPMAVVTGRHERDLAAVLAPHKLANYFVTLIADNQLPHSKPAPDGVLLAIERIGADPARSYYVGDSIVDMQAAHGAGAKPIAALWDELAKPELMAKENPAFMAKSPMEIWRYLGSQ